MKKIAKPIYENGYPKPKKAKCLKCKQWFWLKFVLPQQNYSQKNNWWYYTENEKDKGKYKCNNCLRNFYFQERKLYLETIKSLKKRKSLRTYISCNII